jgi:hypothetical protein
LLEIVATGRPSRSFSRRLHGGQEQPDQDRDDRDDDEKFDEGEAR